MIIALSAAAAAVSVTHLAACGLGRQRLRYLTKLMLMPLVCGLYMALTGKPSLVVVAAMLCGWAGDWFMIYKHREAFLAAGMAAFGLGHIFYVAHIGVLAAEAQPRLFTVLAAILLPGAIALSVFFALRTRIPKELRLPGLLYAGLAGLRGLHRPARRRARSGLPSRRGLSFPLLRRHPRL